MNYRVIAGLFLLLCLGLADNQTIPALLPTLMNAFGTSIRVTSLLVVLYSVGAASAAFFTGSLSDHYGRRPFLTAGAVVFLLTSLAASLSRSFVELTVARTFTGLAAGTLSTCSIAYAGDWFPYRIRGRALGLISSAYFVAPLSLIVIGVIADRFGWPRVFVAFAAVALLVAIASLQLPRDVAPHRLDGGPARHGKLRHTLNVFWHLLGRRDTSAMLVIAFLVSGGLVTFLTYIGFWLRSSFGFNITKITLVFMLGGVVAAGGAPLGGILSDRWGKRGVSIASNILLAVTMAPLPLLGWGAGLLIVFIGVSLAIGFRQGPITALMTEMVPQSRRGSFVAMRNIASQLGIGAAVFTGGLLYAWHGYIAVTSLSALMAAVVALLLTTHITEPAAAGAAQSAVTSR